MQVHLLKPPVLFSVLGLARSTILRLCPTARITDTEPIYPLLELVPALPSLTSRRGYKLCHSPR